MATGAKKIGLLGITFKAEVDDIRESPALYVAAKLRQQGCEIMAHDKEFAAGKVVTLPHKAGDLSLHSLEDVMKESEVLVQFYPSPLYDNLAHQTRVKVIDLGTLLVPN